MNDDLKNDLSNKEVIKLCLEFHVSELKGLIGAAVQKYINGEINGNGMGELLCSFGNDLNRLGEYVIREG